MKAWQFTKTAGGLEKDLKLNTSAPLPPNAASLAADQVLVQVISMALNPVDYKIAELPLVGRLAISKPSSPGIDYAGRVTAAGSNSSDASTFQLNPGQLVFGRLEAPTQFGTLADYTVALRTGCVPIPESVQIDDAASIGTAGLTAYQCVVPNVKPGYRVFINGGSGGTGIFGIQFAKVMKCHVVTSCSKANVELCASLGADEVIDYKRQNVVAELKKMGDFDLVVDNVGTPSELYCQAHEFMKEGRKYVQVGANPSLRTVYTLSGRLLQPAFLGGGKRKFEFLNVKNKPEDFSQIAQWMQEGQVRAVVAERFGMDDEGPIKAFEKLKTGRAQGKILVGINNS